MLKDKIVIVDSSKKEKLVSEEMFYQRLKIVGQGTFGKVYVARSKKDGKLWALKEVHQDRRYKNRQLSILARLQHCNIVGMKQYFLRVIKDECYLSIIMELVPSSLNIMIKEQRKHKRPFESSIRKILAFQLFKALYFLQLTKVCHRDLKPPNLLINDKTFQLKLCDFGSAKILEKEENNVAYICSRYYRAPELVMGATDYHTEIDVWSGGCILIELLTLEPIFPGDSSQEQLIEIIKVLGSPPQRYLKVYSTEKNLNYNLPMIQPASWEKVLGKYDPHPLQLNLLSRVLVYEPKLRLTPLQCLKHPYFHDLPSYCEMVQQLPNIFYFDDLLTGHNEQQIIDLQRLYSSENGVMKKKGVGSPFEMAKGQNTPNTHNTTQG